MQISQPLTLVLPGPHSSRVASSTSPAQHQQEPQLQVNNRGSETSSARSCKEPGTLPQAALRRLAYLWAVPPNRVVPVDLVACWALAEVRGEADSSVPSAPSPWQESPPTSLAKLPWRKQRAVAAYRSLL